MFETNLQIDWHVLDANSSRVTSYKLQITDLTTYDSYWPSFKSSYNGDFYNLIRNGEQPLYDYESAVGGVFV